MGVRLTAFSQALPTMSKPVKACIIGCIVYVVTVGMIGTIIASIVAGYIAKRMTNQMSLLLPIVIIFLTAMSADAMDIVELVLILPAVMAGYSVELWIEKRGRN